MGSTEEFEIRISRLRQCTRISSLAFRRPSGKECTGLVPRDAKYPQRGEVLVAARLDLLDWVFDIR